MNPQDAEEYTQALGQIVAGGWRQVALGKRLGVPRALGLTTEQWATERLGGYVRMSIAERREAVAELTGEGHTEREIGEVLGISHGTVHRDRAAVAAPFGAAGGHEQPAEQADHPHTAPFGAAGGHEQPAEQSEGDQVEPDLLASVPLDAVGALAVGEVRATEAKKAAARTRTPEPIAEPVPPPPGTFRCIVIDPPWPMRKIERDERPNPGVALDYPVMSLDQIADEDRVPVRTLAADDCHIYLWVTHKYLPAGMDLLDAWGFGYQCVMTWRKNVGITPFSWMYDTEHVLFARRGNLKLARLGLRLSFEAPTQGHSVKPDIFYDRVTEASPGPRVEMFARRARHGFTAWGNEVPDVV